MAQTQIQPISPVPNDTKADEYARGHAPPKPPQLPFKVTNPHVRECLAEFLATFVFCLFGLSVNTQVILSKLAAVYKVFPWTKVPGYFAAQFLGAFFGSLFVYDMYYQIIHAVGPGKTWSTRVIFHTHPHALVNNGAAFFTEFSATALVMICLLALMDMENRPTVVPSFPSWIGLLVIGIGMSFSMVPSAALNPTRDFAPRIMLALVGYNGVFSDHDHYFWIPIVALTLGAMFGALIYLVFIMAHHPAVVHNKPFF